ncbi:receptor-type tyrosine-protein phosphatase H [Talpa occidentalis]|uniref:receptor-type tyrosine-protein phosphatase H n=1 Tax=Talpa occidentalis TaxID=50954 RepID=UPI0023F92D10|nr:receptor-type tyrosine-protein phosphatase H [Talpa occidentalis]
MGEQRSWLGSDQEAPPAPHYWEVGEAKGPSRVQPPDPPRTLESSPPARLRRGDLQPANLRVEEQTPTSITLGWDPPAGQGGNYSYGVRWSGPGITDQVRNTTDTSCTADQLQPGTMYQFHVWVEQGENRSQETPIEASTAPNKVGDLSVVTQTPTTITLSWTSPDGRGLQNYTYWVRWAGEDGKAGTQNTSHPSHTVEGLAPASRYEFSVWAEKNGVNGSEANITHYTAPNIVGDLKVVTQTSTTITLSWTSPDDQGRQNYTYWVRWAGEDGKAGTQNTSHPNHTVEGLGPASRYEISVWAEKNGVNGSEANITHYTAPNKVGDLSVVTQTPTTITLSWTSPDGRGLQNYTYWVRWAGEDGKAGTQNTSHPSHTVEGLAPVSRYEFSVWAEKNGVNGSEANITHYTAPNIVGDLKVVTQTSTTITLSWTSPDDQGRQNYTYWVRWAGEDGKAGTQNTSHPNHTVEGLGPASRYEISVWAEKNGVNGSEANITHYTAPNIVGDLSVVTQTPTSINLSWTSPDGRGLQNYTYWVQWTGEDGKAGTQNTSHPNHTVGGLAPVSRYEFSVWAEKNGVNGSEANITHYTAPNQVTGLRNETRSNYWVTLQWEAPEGPPGPRYNYIVQWALDYHNTTELSYRVEGLTPGTPYAFSVRAESYDVLGAPHILQASTAPAPANIISCDSTPWGSGVVLVLSCPLGGFEAFRLEVDGRHLPPDQDNSSCGGRGVDVSGLQPARPYQARVATVWDGELAWSAAVTCHTDSTGVIVGSICGVLLLLLVFLLVFFLKRRSFLPWRMKSARSAPRTPAFSFLTNISAADFAGHVKENEKDSNCGFAEEYQQLALVVRDQPQTVASAPENSAKNRYRNVLPYDWSRVALKPVSGEPGSDYINASFIPGLSSSQEFIATQGPLPQTVGDFWRLVWEQQSRTLVMLTNCIESGRVKCEHYWPLDTKPCTHGDLRVTLTGEEVTDNWAVRSLQLRHVREEKELFVRQFHYLTWPDHGVPHAPDTVLAFWKVLREWLNQNEKEAMGGGPPIVHCSAGVGRTGTLIALDVLLRQLEGEGLVGPFNFVKKMRGSRPLMVQTEAQYVFLHQCILQFLQDSAAHAAEKEITYENLLYENITAI